MLKGKQYVSNQNVPRPTEVRRRCRMHHWSRLFFLFRVLCWVWHKLVGRRLCAFFQKPHLSMLKTYNFCFRCLHKTRSAAVPSTTDLKGFSNLGFIGSNGHIISASSTVDLDKVPGPLDATAMKQPLKKANTFPYQVWSLSQFCTVGLPPGKSMTLWRILKQIPSSQPLPAN